MRLRQCCDYPDIDLIEGDDDSGEWWQVVCYSCGDAADPRRDRDAAIRRWNGEKPTGRQVAS